MNKYNQKSITRHRRLEYWHNIAKKLSQVAVAIQHFDDASPDDFRAFREIYKRLDECTMIADERLALIDGMKGGEKP